MKKKWLPYGLLILIGLCAVLIGTKSGVLFGSVTDWLNQHTVFPDYFRNLFYETGSLFPNFAPHLGAGQNIVHFAYYGLYHPLILLSYLLPMVSMVDYLTVMSIGCYLASGCLCYKWLKGHFKESTSFVAACLLLFASPLLFHAHRHLMFVSYMPFLLLALIGVDRHFEHKSGLLIGSITLMILTSYYYSIGGLCAIVLYGIYRYLTRQEKVTVKKFFQDGFRFLFPVFLGILLASFLLLPVFHTMLSNHTRVNSTVSLANLLFPKLNLGGVLYDSYSLGLTSIAIIAFLYLFSKKKKSTIFLGIAFFILLSVPLIRYGLNGGLYIKNKALIPFLPLFILAIAYFLEHYLQEKKETMITIVVLFFLGFYFMFLGHSFQKYLFDFIGTILLILLSLKFQKRFLVTIPVLIGCFVLTVSTSRSDGFVTQKAYQDFTNPTITEWMKEKTSPYVRTNVLMSTGENINRLYPSYGTSIYSSTYNSAYHTFYKETMALPMPHRNTLMNANSNNLLFDTYMGISYLISDGPVSSGYQKIDEQDGLLLYENKNVYPLGYARSTLLSEQQFLALKDSERMEAFFQGIITKKGTDSISLDQQEKKDLLGELPKNDAIEVTHSDQGWIIQVKQTTTLTIPLKEVLDHQILLLQFDVLKKPECRDGDIAIAINGTSNKLTCRTWGYNNENTTFHYVISEDLLGVLTVTFQKGEYHLSNLQMKTLDQTKLTDTISTLDPWILNEEKSHGDTIVGTINVKGDGYFATSIPYDSGFTAYVDGAKVNIEQVNTAFVGFPISQGKHIVKLVYASPLALEGKIVSMVALFGTFLLLYWERKKRERS